MCVHNVQNLNENFFLGFSHWVSNDGHVAIQILIQRSMPGRNFGYTCKLLRCCFGLFANSNFCFSIIIIEIKPKSDHRQRRSGHLETQPTEEEKSSITHHWAFYDEQDIKREKKINGKPTTESKHSRRTWTKDSKTFGMKIVHLIRHSITVQ